MQSGFTTILVPVDFTINTDIAINKALEVADLNDTTIHLLHVLQENDSITQDQSNNWMIHATALEKLEQWKATINESFSKIDVCFWIQYGPVRETIESKAREIDADLLVIGKQHNHNWLPFLSTVMPSDLATTAAILTVRKGSLHHKIKTIVVPISKTMPYHKMEIISALSHRMNFRIHLVAFSNEGATEDGLNTSLLKMYQWLKNTLHCHVEYALLHDHNRAKAVLNYAEKIDADILLLQADAETKIGWPNKQIPDILPADSKMQVITVRPK